MNSIDPTRIDIRTDPLTKRMAGYTAHKGIKFDVPYMTEILPGLWQGGCEDGLVLPQNIQHVVSLYQWEAYRLNRKGQVKTYTTVFMYDSTEHPIDGNYVLKLAEMVNVCRETGETLVHCQAGLNRSSLIVALALMIGPEQLTAEMAIDLLRQKRGSAVLCNDAFVDFLHNFEASQTATQPS